MTSILTAAQAANILRVSASDALMLQTLPLVDEFIKRATGRDWTQDSPVSPAAVSAATMLLVKWYEDPGQMGNSESLSFGLQAALAQLEAEALKYRSYQFTGLNGAGAIALPGAREGDDVIKLVGLYGATGSQTANFESEISEEGQIQQTSSSDLSENIYLVVLKSPAEDVIP